ncbi:hypothetical protein D1820_07845 [Phaeobacter sp. LSS9]|uniref:hypothetical protein n=1 Tax=unclassified Phaeobacter TaxID=2621772 RepID=UPI000E53A84A|nr:hypothetical protein [Phaeobacter sp. LSS9]AXT34884.1 hypothetical protein D1820_07845 [Phaeobacter sp. LSS9]
MGKAAWSYFGAFAVCLSVIFGAVSFAALYLGERWFAQNKALTVTHSIYLVVILFLLYCLAHRPHRQNFPLPRVRKVLSEDASQSVLLIDPCSWLSNQTAVALFKVEDDVERLIAVGEVILVQQNSFVQIACRIPEAFEGELPKISDIKEKIAVKPGINQQ